MRRRNTGLCCHIASAKRRSPRRGCDVAATDGDADQLADRVDRGAAAAPGSTATR